MHILHVIRIEFLAVSLDSSMSYYGACVWHGTGMVAGIVPYTKATVTNRTLYSIPKELLLARLWKEFLLAGKNFSKF